MHEKENRVSAAYGGTAYWTCGIQLQRTICAEAGNQTFYCFFSVTGKMLNTQNDIKEMIADEIGADCEENWLVGQSKEEALNSYIASGEYPDFILGEKVLLDADALIPIDEYWDDYPNIRNYLSEEQWEHFRQEDGHIYWIHRFVCLRERMLK